MEHHRAWASLQQQTHPKCWRSPRRQDGASSGSPTRSTGTQTVGRTDQGCIVKCWTKVAALLLSVAAIQASAQSAPEGQAGAQETQARGFWTDPSTGLMWTGKDNGKDVSWKKA